MTSAARQRMMARVRGAHHRVDLAPQRPPAADAPQDAGAAQAEDQQGAGTGTEAAPGAEENVPGEENAADEEAAAAPAEGAAGETQVAAADLAAELSLELAAEDEISLPEISLPPLSPTAAFRLHCI